MGQSYSIIVKKWSAGAHTHPTDVSVVNAGIKALSVEHSSKEFMVPLVWATMIPLTKMSVKGSIVGISWTLGPRKL